MHLLQLGFGIFRKLRFALACRTGPWFNYQSSANGCLGRFGARVTSEWLNTARLASQSPTLGQAAEPTLKVLAVSLMWNVSRWFLSFIRQIHNIGGRDDSSMILDDGSWYRKKDDLRSLLKTAGLTGDYAPG